MSKFDYLDKMTRKALLWRLKIAQQVYKESGNPATAAEIEEIKRRLKR